ncbi:Neutral/alkaline nonlysosomal ceramidase [Suillus ampliporus]|nr:Neutral/alkaline nonlysosomal ceramidase [Suillus ampliporus]
MREEYGVQRYEGASTLFGPATLEAYINRYTPQEQTSRAISLQNSVIVDNPPLFKHFGNVLIDVKSSTYHAGDIVAVRFVGANLQNDLRLEGTFFTVNRRVNDEWVVVRTDSHPSMTYQWNRMSTVLGTSTVEIQWTVEDGTPVRTYKIMYYGDAKSVLGGISAFMGDSSTFTVG